jgi:iron complex outermembrane receptor protein
MEKQMISNVLKKIGFRRLAFAAGVGFPLLMAITANAQAPAPPPAGGTAEAERVIVTGSLIPTAEEVTANPVDVISQQEIKASGQTVDILNVLTKRDPDFVGAGNLGQSNASIASGSTQGGTTIQIRGLPTLTLINDRRFALSAAISTGGFVFQDVSVIPTRLIGRIEVLKDGASAIYGSDAVGGVVNVHMNDEFTGLDIGYRYGTRLASGVSERQGWALAGTGNDTTHIVAGFQYYEIDPLFTREEDFGGTSPGLTTTYGGSARDSTSRYLIDSLVPANWPAGSTINSPLDRVGVRSIPVSDEMVPPGMNTFSNGYQQLSNLGVYRAASFAEITSYNLTLKTTDTLDQSVTHAYTSFDQKICGDQLEAFGSFMFMHNKSESFLNAQPLSNATGVVIPSAFNVDPNTGALVANTGLRAPYTPFDLTIDGNTAAGPFRLIAANRYQTNPRVFTNDNDFYRLLGGLKSQITDADHGNWYAEGTANYSHYQTTFVNGNLVRADVLNQLILNQDAAGNAIPGQTLDFFALDPIHNGARSISPDTFNTIFGNNIREQVSYLRSFDAHVRGDVFELPGGPISVAAGVEYRVEGFKDLDSPEIFIGSVPVGQINVGRNIFSAFSELRIPFVGPQMNVPWVYSLELTLQGRYETIEGISGDSKVPKIMLRYQPIKDLTLRGTYGNSFVAPDLFSLFGPPSSGFSPTISFNGVPQDQAQVLVPTNPHLTPAIAQNWTAGLVYSPSWLPGFTLTADYFWTLEQNIVGTLGATTILTSVENLGPASPFASLVAFNNFPGQPGARPITAPGQLNGNLAGTFYIDQLLNVGADRVEGWDLDASYNMDLQNLFGFDAGNLLLDARAVVFMGHDKRTNAQTPYYNILGFVGDENFGVFPDYKLTFLVQHSWHGFTLGVNVNYLPEMQNELGGSLEFDNQSDTTIFPVVDDYVTVDGRLSYTFSFPAPEGAAQAPALKDGKAVADKKAVVPGVFSPSCWSYQTWLNNLTLTVGCNNMFDQDPRIVAGANSSTNLQAYDPYGRFVYFEVDKKF